MERRILSDKQARWLRIELAEWRGRGIVTPQQAEQITACYETPEEAGERFYRIVTDIASGTVARSETVAYAEPLEMYLQEPRF